MTVGNAARSTGQRRLLIVARTAIDSDDVLQTLIERSKDEPAELSVLVPVSRYWIDVGIHSPAWRTAERRLRTALARFRAAGLYVRETQICRVEPVRAALETIDSGQIDEILVATPRRRLRRQAGDVLAERLGTASMLPLTHVRGATPARRRRPPRDGHRLAARVLLAVGLVLLALAAASVAVDADGDRSANSSAPLR